MQVIFSQLLPHRQQHSAARQVSKQVLDNLAPDRIHLKGLTFFGYHGVLLEVSIKELWA